MNDFFICLDTKKKITKRSAFDSIGDLLQRISWERRIYEIWIGEVSWKSAKACGDSDDYIPATIARVQDLAQHVTIDDRLIREIDRAFDLPNRSSYRLADKHAVLAFLELHRGSKVYTMAR